MVLKLKSSWSLGEWRRVPGNQSLLPVCYWLITCSDLPKTEMLQLQQRGPTCRAECSLPAFKYPRINLHIYPPSGLSCRASTTDYLVLTWEHLQQIPIFYQLLTTSLKCFHMSTAVWNTIASGIVHWGETTGRLSFPEASRRAVLISVELYQLTLLETWWCNYFVARTSWMCNCGIRKMWRCILIDWRLKKMIPEGSSKQVFYGIL